MIEPSSPPVSEADIRFWLPGPQLAQPGNSVQLLVDGEAAFPAMLEAISRAKRSILMESYIFNADATGERFADALAERAAAGVPVRLLVDGVGTIAQPRAFYDRLRDRGIALSVYRPVQPWRARWGILRRNHRKILVIDNRVGFAGGLNIGDAWQPVTQGGGWHDVHVRLEGPAVRGLSKLALSAWHLEPKLLVDHRHFLDDPPTAGAQWVAVIGSRQKKARRAIRRAYLHAIHRARTSIAIANPYFIPDSPLRRALRHAVERGVDVRVMLPRHNDVPVVQWASSALYAGLLRSGVRLFEWTENVLHAKTAVIDGIWGTVGSFNLDHLSWSMNLEVNVTLVDRNFARQLQAVFDERLGQCEEIELAAWVARPAWRRAREAFALLFQKWM